MQEHAVSQRGCNLIERLELDMELPNAQIQEECSVVKISVVEEEEKKQPIKTSSKKASISLSKSYELEDEENVELYEDYYAEKEVRWGRKDDKQLFEALRSIQSRYEFDIEEIERLKTPSSCPELKELASMIGWRGTMKRLIRRIKNVGKLRELSVREFKRLKRLVKNRFIGREIDYDDLLYEFPGKTLQQLREASEEIIKHKRTRGKKARKNLQWLEIETSRKNLNDALNIRNH